MLREPIVLDARDAIFRLVLLPAGVGSFRGG